LLKFASEVSQGTRRDGLDYKSGPRLLLSWGDRKFTKEGSLPEVIESMARAQWLVLNGTSRVHAEPGFGRCLKLVERETAMFWRLIWFYGLDKPLEPESAAPIEEETPAGPNEAQPPGEPSKIKSRSQIRSCK